MKLLDSYKEIIETLDNTSDIRNEIAMELLKLILSLHDRVVLLEQKQKVGKRRRV